MATNADRPVFHFTAPKNWLNDPNGLVYLDGEYHLFYQYNPDGMVGAGRNMHWGHAVSRDLLSWEHLPIALHNDEPRQAYSGSAIVDEANVLGLRVSGGPKTLVACYTRTGVGQCLASSVDRGRSWFEHGPVIPYASDAARERTDRDPRVFWHEPTRAYVMVLYERSGYSFYRSTDLMEWKHASYIEGFYECPELVELAVTEADGSSKESRWVLFDGDGSYVVGSFDGSMFTPESPKLRSDMGPSFYATQCWLNAPDGRVIQIAWMNGGNFENCDYSQQMSVPCELSLARNERGAPELRRLPVRELPISDRILGETDVFEYPGPGRYRVFLCRAGRRQISVCGYLLNWWPDYEAIGFVGRVVPVRPGTGDIDLEIVIDRRSIELFVDQGRQSISFSGRLR